MTFTLYLIPRNPRKIISHILGYHGEKKGKESPPFVKENKEKNVLVFSSYFP